MLCIAGTAIAIVAIGATVQWSFHRSLDLQLENHLAAYTDLLVGAIHLENDTVTLDDSGGLLASIPRHWQVDLLDRPIAKSPQLTTRFPVRPASTSEPQRVSIRDESGLEITALQTAFPFPDGPTVIVTFGLETKIANAYAAQLRGAFQNDLYVILLFSAAVLIGIGAVQWYLVSRPLRAVGAALDDVHAGSSERIAGRFPKEIQALADEINSLLERSFDVIKRHRLVSANTAHELKTPLAFILNESDSPKVRTKVAMMLRVIDRNLARADAGGLSKVAVATPVASVVDRIADGFGKIHHKEIDIDCPDHILFRGDEADLYEILGNAIENACKFGTSKVLVTCRGDRITVEDDGPGIPATERDAVLTRGTRLDESKPGTGIGLSITKDIVELNGGSLSLTSSALGGLKVVIELPG